MLGRLCRLLAREEGQAMTEYALILLVLVTAAVIVALTVFGNAVVGLFQQFTSVLS